MDGGRRIGRIRIQAIAIASSCLVLLLLCNACTNSIPLGPSESDASIASEDNGVTNITIDGYSVNEENIRVAYPLLATLQNNVTGVKQFTPFNHGNFVFVVQVPTWASLDDELFLNITSRDMETSYGTKSFSLNQSGNYVNETIFTIDVLVQNTPRNYSSLYVLLLMLGLIGVFALYALYARWMLGRIIVSRAEKIRIDGSRRSGRRER
ncbi:MAG TPA: hypothetical protein ENN25_07420 [Euryarchaeota archaeon]|nr:hypothetical protein [Euryarchaeota archaeon]